MQHSHTLALTFALFLTNFLHGQELTALLINPPGADADLETIQLEGMPNASLSGLTFLVIEGDNTGAGIIDQAIDMGALSPNTLGANGVFILRGGATVLVPAPAAATNVAVEDFDPNLENGTNTFLLVRGFSGSVGDDLDASPQDGTLDATPWTEVVSVVAAVTPVNSPTEYASQLGGQVVQLTGSAGCAAGTPANAGFLFLTDGTWNGTVVNSGPGGSFVYDATRTFSSACDDLSTVYGGGTIQLGQDGSFLPVRWSSVEASRQLNGILLSWSTDREWNNRQFIVEKSNGSRSFEAIGTVRSGSSPETTQYYQFLDRTARDEAVIYRIRQVDHDGSYSLSPLVQVAPLSGSEDGIKVFPTVAAGGLVQINGTDQISGSFILTDMSGRRVGEYAANSSQINVSHLPAGTYHLRLLRAGKSPVVWKVLR